MMATTKTTFRQDIRNARHILRRLECAITAGDWNTVEVLGRDLESLASLVACSAEENADALATLPAVK